VSQVRVSGTSPLETIALAALVLGAQGKIGPMIPTELILGDIAIDLPPIPPQIWQQFSATMMAPGTVPFDASGKDTPSASVLDYTLPFTERSQMGPIWYRYLDYLSLAGDHYLPLLAIRGYALVVIRVLEAYGAAHGNEALVGAFNDALTRGWAAGTFWMGAVAVEPASYVISGPTAANQFGKVVTSDVWATLDAGARIMQFLGAPFPSALTRPEIPVDEWNLSTQLVGMGRDPSPKIMNLGGRANVMDAFMTYYPDALKLAVMEPFAVGSALQVGLLQLSGAIAALIPLPTLNPVLVPLDLEGQPCATPDGHGYGVYDAHNVCVRAADAPDSGGPPVDGSGAPGPGGAPTGGSHGGRYHGAIDQFGRGGDGSGSGSGHGNGNGNDQQLPDKTAPAAGMSTGAKVAITTGVAAAGLTAAWKLGLFKKLGK